MGLFGKNKKRSEGSHDGPLPASASASAPAPAATSASNGHHQVNHGGQAASSSKHPKGHGGTPSKTKMMLCGLPLVVYGLEELTPSQQAPPPPVCVTIHLHGRGGDAANENWICEDLWKHAREERQRYREHLGRQGQPLANIRDHILVTFDARNHGHRMLDQKAQKGWGVGNQNHAMDLYAMITGTAADASYIVDYLAAYLFPNDDRKVTHWSISGKSLGGHAVWHALKDDPRITIGVPMIGMPDFQALLAYRTQQSHVNNGPPQVPNSLKQLVKARDPAQSAFDRWGPENPFWGKRIMTLNGLQDSLVHASFSQPFLSRLIVSEPQGEGGQQQGLKVRWLDGVKHEVNRSMVGEAGQWIGYWGCVA